jgi:hypothetical protein
MEIPQETTGPAVAFRPKAARQGQATQGQRAMAIAEETLADLL